MRELWKNVNQDENGIRANILKDNNQRISYNFLKSVCSFFLEKLDQNYDYKLSDEDFVGFRIRDDYIKLMKNIITIPYPLYVLYTYLDENKNKIFSQNEIENFIKKTFILFDKNEDCEVDLAEILEVLDEANVPVDKQLAFKMLAYQQLSVASYIVNHILKAGDLNQDGITEVEELLKVSNFNIITDIEKIVGLVRSDNLIKHIFDGEDSWLTILMNLTKRDVYNNEIDTLKCN